MRTILHSDLNSYYASVEVMLDPALRGRALAVCGCRETRHGIVLAKSEPAKKAGVKTGMAIWEARECCPDLLVIPPHYEEYLKYSERVHAIYERYTGYIEPFGIDECWLDVTGIKDRTGMEIAQEIRKTTKAELSLTVSIGVSFNKVFAKLGSDMKKPDAITEIPYDSFREKIWPLPVADLLGVGSATQRKLHMRCVDTIGDLACMPPEALRSWLGINGVRLWAYANGLDDSRVAPANYTTTAKSVGHGMTTVRDLETDEDVRTTLLVLVPRISRKLREACLLATGVQVSLRQNDLTFIQFQTKLANPTQSTRDIVSCAMALFKERYEWDRPVMALTVRATDLIPEGAGVQLDFFGTGEAAARQERLERAVAKIQDSMDCKIQPATLLGSCFKDTHPELEFMHMPSHAFA